MLILFVVLAGAGCAVLQPVYDAEPIRSRLASNAATIESSCARLFAQVDRVIDSAGVRDARATRIEGFPYLRGDRVLAALARQARDGVAFDAWLRLAARLDEEARGFELANLTDPGRRALPDPFVEKTLNECRVQLAGADASSAESRSRLRDAAQVPFTSRQSQSALGLYPLARSAFTRGVRRRQLDTEAVFNTPPGALPRRGRLVRYAPGFLRPAPEDVLKVLTRSSRHPLGLPDWTEAEKTLIFIAFAPEFIVDEATHDDRLGALDYDHDGGLWVNFFKTVVYRRLAFARLDGRWLPQLVYSVWFPARTAESRFDPPARAFDGFTWRVTIGSEGRPLLFDTMHHRGCCHLFIPTPAVRVRHRPESLDETLFAPLALNRVQLNDGVALRLEAGTHYLQRVIIADSGARQARLRDARLYEFAEHDELRSLPLPRGGRKSAFGADGGVVDMRQLDDPHLLDKYFELE